MIKVLLSFYFIFFIGLPLGFTLKNTKDVLLPKDPSLDGSASMMAAIYACNGFDGKVAYTKEEFKELAEYNLKDCLSKLAITCPIGLLGFWLDRKLENWAPTFKFKGKLEAF